MSAEALVIFAAILAFLFGLVSFILKIFWDDRRKRKKEEKEKNKSGILNAKDITLGAQDKLKKEFKERFIESDSEWWGISLFGLFLIILLVILINYLQDIFPALRLFLEGLFP